MITGGRCYYDDEEDDIVGSSGQPKQAETEIGQNRNKSLWKAEASAETEASAEMAEPAEIGCFGRNTLFWPKYIVSAVKANIYLVTH